MSNVLTGDDIEDALSIIENNGGLGEWETADPTNTDGPRERWNFPRFAGASDPGDMYLSRSGLGPYDTDVETVAAWLEAPRNVIGGVLLLSEPGTGKTALIEAAVTHLTTPEEGDAEARTDRRLITVLCTPDHTKDSLLLRFVGEGNGEAGTPFSYAAVAYAAKYGHVLYLDEFMLLPDGVKPILYSLADGRRFLPEGEVDGSPLAIHPDFRLVLSSNPQVRGASMPEPLASRFASTTLTVETTSDMLIDLGIDSVIVDAWQTLGTQGLWRPQIREMRAADYWMDVDPSQAASAFLGEHCPESQREAVRDTVLALVGGALRKDGRLVVK